MSLTDLQDFPDDFKEQWVSVLEDCSEEQLKGVVLLGLYFIYQNNNNSFDEIKKED